MSKDSGQVAKAAKQFKLGHLGTLNQVIVALGKTIRAMADGSVDSQVGSRIANGLGIMRQCLETRTLDQLGERLDQIEGAGGHMARQTVTRLTSRIEDLAEQLPSRKRTMICGGSDAECRAKLEAMRAAGHPVGRHILFIIIDTSGENRP